MKFSYTRPVHAGDRLTVTTHIAEIDTRMGNDFLMLRAEIETDEGEPVVTALSQLVIRAEES
jgi:acyl-CoA thioesterase FadM